MFKDNYLSGILAFKMSAYIARALVQKDNIDAYIEIDFVPEYTEEELRTILKDSPLDNPLNGILHKSITFRQGHYTKGDHSRLSFFFKHLIQPSNHRALWLLMVSSASWVVLLRFSCLSSAHWLKVTAT